jgi:hypothetical protein
VRLAAVLRDVEILGPPMYFMEIPLWDIIGKKANLPVYRLRGAASDGATAYCATAEIRLPEQCVRDAQRIVAEGYRAMKLRLHNENPSDDLKVVEAIRAKLSDRIGIMVDANQAGVEPGHGGHQPWGFQRTVEVVRELEKLGTLWLEDPQTARIRSQALGFQEGGGGSRTAHCRSLQMDRSHRRRNPAVLSPLLVQHPDADSKRIACRFERRAGENTNAA